MSKIELGVHYYLDFLQIKNNSLFTRIKIYLISDGVKRIVAQAKQIQNNRISLETTISEHKALLFSEANQLYEPSHTIFQLEFQADGRFIKMGETVVNVSEMANSRRSEHREAFKVEKCLDRNAKLWMKVLLFSQALKWANNPLLQSQSYSNMSEIYSTNKFVPARRHQINKTQYSINEQDEERDNYEILSQVRTNFPKKHLIDRQNHEKTQAPNRIYYQTEEIAQLQQELSIANTDLRLTLQQLAALKNSYCELLQSHESVQAQLRQSHTEHFKIANYCDELQEKIKRLEISIQSHSSQAHKYKNLYHQSQQERNKLLVDNQQSQRQQRQKRRDLQNELAESQNRVKHLLSKDQGIKAQLEQSTSEMQALKRTVQKEQSFRYRQKQEINDLKITIKKINQEYQKKNHQNAQLKQKKLELLSQLELCRFSLSELEKEIADGKQKMNEKDKMIERYESQIEKAKEAWQKDMHKYSTQLQRVQEEAKQECRSLQEYIEELETKTINDYSKLNQFDRLKKQIASLNNALLQQQDKYKDLQIDRDYLLSDKQNIQQRLEEQQALTLKLTRQKTNVQNALKAAQQQQMEILEAMNSQKLNQEERELMIQRSCRERDSYWQGQIDKIQKDTFTLIDKWKKQRQSFAHRIGELSVEISNKEQDLNQLSDKYKKVQSEMRQLKKSLSQKDSQCKSLTLQLDKLLSEHAAKEKRMQHLSSKMNSLETLEASVKSSQLALSSKTKELDTIRAQLQQEKIIRLKQRYQAIQFLKTIATFLTQPSRHINITQQFNSQHIDTETSVTISTALQDLCDRHYKMKQQLQTIQAQREELSKKQRQVQKANISLLEKRSASKKSLHVKEEDDTYRSPGAFRLRQKIQPNKEENLVAMTLMKQQNQSLKQRLQRQESKNKDLQHQIHKLEKDTDNLQSQIKRLSDDIDQKAEETSNLMLRLTSKENQVQTCREEIKDALAELSQTKVRLEEANRLLQQERTKAFLKKPQPLSSSPSKNDQSFKLLELERRLQVTQEELDRVKTEKQDRRREEGTNLKQIKQLEIKVREKETIICELKKQAESEKTRLDQQKEMLLLRERKLKHDLEEQVQRYHKAERDLKEKVVEEQQKLKQAQKKIKNLEDTIKNLGNQLSNAQQREERTKRMIATECDLKTKSLQIEHQNQQAVLKRVIEQQKFIEKSLRDKIQVKEVEILRLANQIQKRQLIIEDSKAELDIYRMRVNNFQEEEGQYKQTIEVLQNKIKADSNNASRKSIQKAVNHIQLRSNSSLRDFSFR